MKSYFLSYPPSMYMLQNKSYAWNTLRSTPLNMFCAFIIGWVHSCMNSINILCRIDDFRLTSKLVTQSVAPSDYIHS